MKKVFNKIAIGFSHLCGHEFRHGFGDILNPLCPCFIEAETTTQFSALPYL